MPSRSSTRARAHARLAAITLLLAGSLVSSVAHADPEGDAKDLFSRGRDRRLQGNCAEAVQDFRRALSLFPAALGSARNIAECEETLGHWASARRSWLDLKRAASTSNDPKYETWTADAEAAAKRLAPLVSHVTVFVVVAGKDGDVPATSASGIRLSINGEPLAVSLIGSPLDRDPGSYTVRLQGPPGASSVEEPVILAAGEEKTLRLRIVIPEAAMTKAPRALALVPDDDPYRLRRTAGWITLGAGGGALVGAAISAIVRATALADVRRQCANYAESPCDPSVRGDVTRGQTATTLANVLGTVGALGAATGLVLIVLSPASHDLAIRPSVGRLNGLVTEWTL